MHGPLNEGYRGCPLFRFILYNYSVRIEKLIFRVSFPLSRDKQHLLHISIAVIVRYAWNVSWLTEKVACLYRLVLCMLPGFTVS